MRRALSLVALGLGLIQTAEARSLDDAVIRFDCPEVERLSSEAGTVFSAADCRHVAALVAEALGQGRTATAWQVVYALRTRLGAAPKLDAAVLRERSTAFADQSRALLLLADGSDGLDPSEVKRRSEFSAAPGTVRWFPSMGRGLERWYAQRVQALAATSDTTQLLRSVATLSTSVGLVADSASIDAYRDAAARLQRVSTVLNEENVAALVTLQNGSSRALASAAAHGLSLAGLAAMSRLEGALNGDERPQGVAVTLRLVRSMAQYSPLVRTSLAAMLGRIAQSRAALIGQLGETKTRTEVAQAASAILRIDALVDGPATTAPREERHALALALADPLTPHSPEQRNRLQGLTASNVDVLRATSVALLRLGGITAVPTTAGPTAAPLAERLFRAGAPTLAMYALKTVADAPPDAMGAIAAAWNSQLARVATRNRAYVVLQLPEEQVELKVRLENRPSQSVVFRPASAQSDDVAYMGRAAVSLGPTAPAASESLTRASATVVEYRASIERRQCYADLKARAETTGGDFAELVAAMEFCGRMPPYKEQRRTKAPAVSPALRSWQLDVVLSDDGGSARGRAEANSDFDGAIATMIGRLLQTRLEHWCEGEASDLPHAESIAAGALLLRTLGGDARSADACVSRQLERAAGFVGEKQP
jgi:hypothetical protein